MSSSTAGCSLGEFGERGGEMGDAEGERRREPDRPGHLGHRFGHHLLRRLEIGKDGGGARIISLADLGGLSAARRPGQQPRAQPFLEPRHPARDDGLRKPHPLGGAGEGAGLDHPHEGEHVEQIGRTMFHVRGLRS